MLPKMPLAESALCRWLCFCAAAGIAWPLATHWCRQRAACLQWWRYVRPGCPWKKQVRMASSKSLSQWPCHFRVKVHWFGESNSCCLLKPFTNFPKISTVDCDAWQVSAPSLKSLTQHSAFVADPQCSDGMYQYRRVMVQYINTGFWILHTKITLRQTPR